VSPRSWAPPAALAAAAIATTASASGAYFPPAWGWSALALLLAAAAGLAVGDRIELTPLELVALGSLTALVAFAAVSSVWSQSLPRSVLDAQRGLVYVAALAAFLVLCSREAAPALAAGALAGAAFVSLWGLVAQLFPDRFGLDRGAAGQLARPLGYWNGMGMTAVAAVLLALALAAHGALPAVRAAAAALGPPLVATLYLTFSRGGWVALAAGLLLLVALHPARGRLAVTAALVAVPAGAAVWFGTRADALTRTDSPLGDAAHAGHRLALAVAALAGVAAAVPALADRVPLPSPPRRARPWLLLLAGVAAAAVVAVGTRAVGRAYDAFRSPTVSTGGDLNDRLFSGSGNARADYWRVAWRDVTAHPLAGSGAGTFELRWYRERPNTFGARDAHNLYLETLAELGPLGLALLVLALGAPLAALRGPRAPLVAGAGAAYCAYLVHAALDWDWELPTVTLTALACAAAVLAAHRGRSRTFRVSPAARAVGAAAAVALAAAAGLGYAQATALANAVAARDDGALARAESQARRAARLAPWQAEPWTVVGDVQLIRGLRPQALASYRRAVDRDPGDWFTWYELARGSLGRQRTAALAEARRRNPRGPELAAR
jgi:tetratricopeptide (TPR) repeat protein